MQGTHLVRRLWRVHPLGRRLKRLRHSIGAPLGLDGLRHPDDVLVELCRWGVSQPWVVEPGGSELEASRRFVVDCELLQRRQPWFALSGLGDHFDEGPRVLVAVPRRIAGRGVALGWDGSVVELDADRSVVDLALPTTSAELCALQQFLSLAYSAIFGTASSSG
jgi:hypothetical protein